MSVTSGAALNRMTLAKDAKPKSKQSKNTTNLIILWQRQQYKTTLWLVFMMYVIKTIKLFFLSPKHVIYSAQFPAHDSAHPLASVQQQQQQTNPRKLRFSVSLPNGDQQQHRQYPWARDQPGASLKCSDITATVFLCYKYFCDESKFRIQIQIISSQQQPCQGTSAKW